MILRNTLCSFLILSFFGCSQFIKDTIETEKEIPPVITFDANGGTINNNSQTLMYNESSYLRSADSMNLKRQGYAFAGWSELKNAKDPNLKDGNSICLTKNLTLYAIWYDCDYITNLSNLGNVLGRLPKNTATTPYRVYVLDLKDSDFVTRYYESRSPFDNQLCGENYVNITLYSDALTKITIGSTDKLVSLSIPYGVQTLYIHGCGNLSKVDFPESLEKFTFYACYGLRNITVPSSVTELNDINFFCCKNLEEVILPNHLKKIGGRCFCSCTSLKELIIPSEVEFIDTSAFEECSNLKSVQFNDSSNWYITSSYENWTKKTGGYNYDASDPSKNANQLRTSNYYWYKN